MQVHRLSIGAGQDKGGGFAALWADGAEYIGPFIALVAWRARTRSPLGPDAGQRALLADARFVLEPYFERFSSRGFRDRADEGRAKVS
jgi:hypothetical protein